MQQFFATSKAPHISGRKKICMQSKKAFRNNDNGDVGLWQQFYNRGDKRTLPCLAFLLDTKKLEGGKLEICKRKPSATQSKHVGVI